MGGGISSAQEMVATVEAGDLSSTDMQKRYLLRNKPQAKALKKYLEKLAIPLALVDRVRCALVQTWEGRKNRFGTRAQKLQLLQARSIGA